jgi:hypothetical protein
MATDKSILFSIRADGTKINIDIDMMWKVEVDT